MGELLRLRGTRSIGSAWRTTKSGAFVCHEQNSVAYILATSLPLGLLLLEEEIHTFRPCNGLHCSKTNALKVAQRF